jgi:hypothetical protein
VGLGVCKQALNPRFFVSATRAGIAQRHNNAGEQVDFWQVLPVAVALVFIIEGMLPFISPHRWRNMLATQYRSRQHGVRDRTALPGALGVHRT